jgi:hypothetical protein
MNDTVFFGGDCGLYKLDTNGKLLKRYDPNHAPMPGGAIYDVCQGDGKIYFVFQGSPHRGVAVLDPKSERIAVLAPSSRDASPQSEPQGVCRLRWDAATPRLCAFSYTYWFFSAPDLSSEYSWTPKDRKWQLHPIKDAPLLVVSDGDETLSVKVSGDRSQFHFVKADQDVTADVPLPLMMGEPAWDEHRIWIPTASGLYEVDRATGHVTWLAYRIDAPTASGPYAADFAVGRVPWATYPNGPLFFSVLRHGNRLYVATSRGLYYREIVPMPTSKITSAPSPTMQPPSQSAPHMSVELSAAKATPAGGTNGHGSSEPGAESAPQSDENNRRVTAISSDILIMYGHALLSRNASTRKELRFTKDQEKRLREISDTYVKLDFLNCLLPRVGRGRMANVE